MFRPYLSEHIRPNNATAAAADDDGAKKQPEFSHVLLLQANACGTKRVKL